MAVFQWLGVRQRNGSAPAISKCIRRKRPASDEQLETPALRGNASGICDGHEAMGSRHALPQSPESLAARNFTIVVTAGPGEESYAARSRAAKLKAPSSCWAFRFPNSAELIRGARIYIGNDSGPMHLAAAVGTPAVAVWGSSDSRRWRPWSVEHRVVQNPFECNPCPGYRCLVADSPLCIESVTVDQVNAAVEEVCIPVGAVYDRADFVHSR